MDPERLRDLWGYRTQVTMKILLFDLTMSNYDLRLVVLFYLLPELLTLICPPSQMVAPFSWFALIFQIPPLQPLCTRKNRNRGWVPTKIFPMNCVVVSQRLGYYPKFCGTTRTWIAVLQKLTENVHIIQKIGGSITIRCTPHKRT